MEKYKLRLSSKQKKPKPQERERETAPPYEPRRSSNYIPSDENFHERSDLPSSELSQRRDFDLIAENLRLPPILTKIPNPEEEETLSSPSFRRFSNKIQFSCLSKSFAVVKFSSNPQRDFKESMEEMIRENRITSSKELEELLSCFLSLNSGEYRDDIFRAFEEIWSGISERRRREGFRPKHCR